jgi:hypothetical protein
MFTFAGSVCCVCESVSVRVAVFVTVREAGHERLSVYVLVSLPLRLTGFPGRLLLSVSEAVASVVFVVTVKGTAVESYSRSGAVPLSRNALAVFEPDAVLVVLSE